MANEKNLKPFVKGDPRINRKGVKSFKQLRALVVSVLNEPTSDNKLRLEKMLKEMSTSGNPADHKLLLKYGFGNVPDETVVSGKIKYVVKIKDDTND
jgi:hypothetical protein